MISLTSLRADLPPSVDSSRQLTFSAAVIIALGSRSPRHHSQFAIVDRTSHFGVYPLCDFLEGSPACGSFPATKIPGTLIATVDHDGFLDHVTEERLLS